MKEVVITSESFGYGPIISCLHVMKRLKQKKTCSFIFVGSGIAMERAKDSMMFDVCIECITYDADALQQVKPIFQRAEIIISFENPVGAIFGLNLNKKVFYIDNLFWMWDNIPMELKNVTMYFIVDAFNNLLNIDRIGRGIVNKFIIGPLRDLSFAHNAQHNMSDEVTINIGGAESYLSDESLVAKYYATIINVICDSLDVFSTKMPITVCGGLRTLERIAKHCNRTQVILKSLPHEDCLNLMQSSRYLFLSPGLGNFFEALTLHQRVCFLPPINYSQYWQILQYKCFDLGMDVCNWSDFTWFYPIEKYIDEKVGVQQVEQNLQRYLEQSNNNVTLLQHFSIYLNKKVEDWQPMRSEFAKNFRRDGAIDISEIIYTYCEEI